MSASRTESTSRAGITLLLTSAATFMAFLDTTVVNVAFPDLHADFPDESLVNLTWVVTSYGVLFAALLVAAGRYADVVGRRAMFMGSVALFTLASLGCALAPNVDLLIAARAVQGIGAAGMIPAALGLVLAETPAEKRTEAIGIWGAAGSMAAAAGPSLGGLLVSEISWRSVFVLNIPIGLAVLVAGLRALPSRTSEDRALPDLVGTVAFTAGIGAIVLGLTEGDTWGWTSASTLGWIVAGVLLGIFALARSARLSRTRDNSPTGNAKAPAIETGLWRSHMFAAANLTSFLLGAGLFIWFLSGPLYLTTVWHYSVLKAGLAVTPGAVASAIAAIVIGKRIKPEGQRAVLIVSVLVFLGLSIWAYTVLDATPTFLTVWLPYGLVGGLAVGAALLAVTTAASISVHPLKFASGTGMNTMARQFGGSVGIAAMAAVFASHNLLEPQAYLDAFLLSGIFVGAALIPAVRLFAPKDMATIAETQRQIQAYLAAQAAAAAKAGSDGVAAAAVSPSPSTTSSA